MLKKLILVGCLTLIANSQTLLANDTSIGDENGTIVFQQQPDISMEKETLFISEDEVRVDYVFANTSKKYIQTRVTFPMPPIYIGLSDHNTIEDFKLWINDIEQKVNYQLVVKLKDGTDISQTMAELGWTPSDVEAYAYEQTLPAKKTPPPKHWFDADGTPRFTMSNYFTWTQIFPAGKSVHVRHAYRPSKYTGVPNSSASLIKEFSKTACIDARTQAGMKKLENKEGLNWSFISYILLTANNWQGPIKEFELTIKKRDAADILSLCFGGELKKLDPVTFVFRQLNFRPKEDINLLFIAKVKL
ncbi:MAG TPA: DUF4424 family protein [Cellvibrionaceae bacterium]